MTKGELIDGIYLNLAGGKPSKDLNIQRIDIATLLPLFIADALKIFQQETRRDEYEEIKIYGGSSGELVNPQFLTTFRVTPEEDTELDLYSIVVPKNVAVLPFGRGLNSLSPKQGTGYIRVKSFDEIAAVADHGTFYWSIDLDGVKKILIHGIGHPVCEHFLKIVVDFSDLDDDDDVHIPPGMNKFVLQESRAYLLGERQIPAEYQIDYKQDA